MAIIVAGVVVAGIGLWLTSAGGVAGCPQIHVAVQLGGSNPRLAGLLHGCTGLDHFPRTVWFDFIFILGYVALFTGLLGATWVRYTADQMQTVRRLVPWLPVIVGGLDVLENVLSLTLVSFDRGMLRYAGDGVGGTAIATVAWLKWLGAAVMVIAAIMGVVAFVNKPRRPHATATTTPGSRIVGEGRTGQPGEETKVGVACSGGGIRAGAFTLGVLEALEGHPDQENPQRADVFERVTRVSAVSGGGYAATAWMLARATMPRDLKHTAAHQVHRWLATQVPGRLTWRQSYLLNGPGGIGRSLVLAIVVITGNLAGLAA